MKKEQSTTSLNSDLSLHLLQPPIGPAKGVVRCAVLGAPMVGKSNLVQAILDKGENVSNEGPGKFSHMQATASNGTRYTLAIMDVPAPGDEDDSYIVMLEGMEILLVCFSLVDKRSLQQVEKTWIPFLIMMKLHGYFAPNSVCCVESSSVWNDIIKFFFFNLETILVATKADLKKGIVNRHTRASSDPNVRPEKPVKMASGSVLVQSDQGALLADQLGADAYLEVSSTTGRGIAKLLEEVIAKPIVKGRSSPMSLVKIPQSMSYMFSNHSAYTPSTSNAPNAPQSREPNAGRVETPPKQHSTKKSGKGRGKKKRDEKRDTKKKCILQ